MIFYFFIHYNKQKNYSFSHRKFTIFQNISIQSEYIHHMYATVICTAIIYTSQLTLLIPFSDELTAVLWSSGTKFLKRRGSLQNRWVKWVNNKNSLRTNIINQHKLNCSISYIFIFMISDGYDNYDKLNELTLKYLLSKLITMNWKKCILSETSSNHLNALYLGYGR